MEGGSSFALVGGGGGGGGGGGSSSSSRSGAASIPSRHSLNLHLGPSAEVPPESVEHLLQHRHPTHRLSSAGRRQQLQPQRVRWSRMSVTAAAAAASAPAPASPPLPLALGPAVSASAASLCQLVDFGETRDLIRRQREASKKMAEVNSIVSHLSLDKENAQEPDRTGFDWATFKAQPNSQFKQYVFQSPGRAPVLPTEAPPTTTAAAAPRGLQRSRTTLGLVAGHSVAQRQSRAAASHHLVAAAASTTGLGQRSSTRVVQQVAQHQQDGRPCNDYKGQGYSSSSLISAADGLYGHFEHRKTKSFRLD